MSEKSDQSSDLELNQPLLKELIDHFSFTQEKAKLLFSEFEPDYIKQKIEFVKTSENFKQGKIRDLAAYLVSALKLNYKSSNSSRQLSQQALLEKKQKKQEQDLQAKLEEKKREAHQKYISEQIDLALETISDSLRSEIEKSFHDHASSRSDPMLYKLYLRDGFESRVVKSMFRNFIKNNYPDIIPEIKPYDVFVGLIEVE